MLFMLLSHTRNGEIYLESTFYKLEKIMSTGNWNYLKKHKIDTFLYSLELFTDTHDVMKDCWHEM